jgi:hypothetical protein
MKPRKPPHSTVPQEKPPHRAPAPRPPRVPRPDPPKPRRANVRRREIASIIDQSETSLVDVIDNLLNRGVVLNADVLLALADIDLVYIRLSALLCAADRVFPGDAR